MGEVWREALHQMPTRSVLVSDIVPGGEKASEIHRKAFKSLEIY